MTKTPRRPFSFRAFWALLLAVTVIGLPGSGVELHLTGDGGWTTARHAWMAVHWVFALLFVVAAVGHVVLNGRALLRHLRGLGAWVLPFSWEAIAVLAITAVLLLLAVGHTRPHGGPVQGPEHGVVHADR